jgi:hypothetical protein
MSPDASGTGKQMTKRTKETTSIKTKKKRKTTHHKN